MYRNGGVSQVHKSDKLHYARGVSLAFSATIGSSVGWGCLSTSGMLVVQLDQFMVYPLTRKLKVVSWFLNIEVQLPVVQYLQARNHSILQVMIVRERRFLRRMFFTPT
jgi:hypothetical protein